LQSNGDGLVKTVYKKLRPLSRSVQSFQFVDATTTMQQVFAQVGPPDGDIGSGIDIFVYGLSDGSSIFIGSADPAHVMYVDHGTNLPDGMTSPDHSEQLYPKQ
jgi:hypothetical protein